MRIGGYKGTGKLVQNIKRNSSEELIYVVGCNCVFAAENAQLIQKRNTVSHSARRIFSNRKQSVIGNINFFVIRDISQMFNNIIGCNSSEIKSLAAALNCIKDFVNFCCRKDENNVFRRFFKCFQQRIECRIRKHMDFVDNIDFVFAVNRCIENFFQNILSIFNFSVACGIDFNNIHGNGVCNIHTAFTHTAGVNRRSLLAV